MYNIAIIGPPRSGTSLVANLIHSAGFSSSPNEKAKFFGASEMNLSSNFNPNEAINNYISRINYNQEAVFSAAENIKKIIEEVKHNIVFFGAGRVLDFFVKYGSLDLQSEKIILVDNFLSNGTDSLYGKK